MPLGFLCWLDESSFGLGAMQTAEEKKRRLRSELLRWHPDKFQALFGRNLRAGDAERILAKVKEISQVINVASK